MTRPIRLTRTVDAHAVPRAAHAVALKGEGAGTEASARNRFEFPSRIVVVSPDVLAAGPTP
ncbi:hypothetical protein [Gordonia rhizosphera]|uniref:hypothetical protein n=1 Tax=Gordonia rhizosphera TaxID=83341 RepID=UPI0002FB1BC7|nr:hypothetical protein [Gordonia rhizosphera]